MRSSTAPSESTPASTSGASDEYAPAVHCAVDVAMGDEVVVAAPRALEERGELVLNVGGRFYVAAAPRRLMLRVVGMARAENWTKL